jgi:hypothetical protein
VVFAVQLLADDLTLVIESCGNEPTISAARNTTLESHLPDVHPVTLFNNPSLAFATACFEKCNCFITMWVTVKVHFLCYSIAVHQA